MPELNRKLFTGIAVFFLCGCASTIRNGTVDYDNMMIFPAPPETARIQLLRTISSSSDIREYRKLDQFVFGSSLLDLEIGIEKPYGVAIHDGVIYVCDTMLPGLVVIDLKKGTFQAFQPFGRATLRKPVNLAIDAKGTIFVADSERQQVVVYSPDLEYLYTIASKSVKPIDVAILGDSLFIADYQDREVEVWSIRRQEQIGVFPAAAATLADSLKAAVPYSLTIDDRDNIYITDFGQFRVVKYDREGNFSRAFGGLGRNLGQFARPKGIAVDREENLYVIDAAFENAQLFDRDGQLLMFFGGAYQRPGNMYLPAQIVVDYHNNEFFRDYVIPGYELDYIIIVTNQYGPDKIGIYGRIHLRGEPAVK
ncbi:MAG: hypothetical protein ABIA75_12750 [Candidatus Neomarinimicrobiota bacterium]